MKRRLSLFILCISALRAVATGQIPERIIIAGDTLALCSEPLVYMDSLRRIELLRKIDVPLDEMRGFPIVECTGLGRGYQGLWQLRNDSLILLRMENVAAVFGDSPEKARSLDFPGGMFAGWFTGRLRVVQGKIMSYVHLGYGSCFEQETFYAVKAGRVVGSREADNRLIGDYWTFQKQLNELGYTFTVPQLEGIDSTWNVRVEAVAIPTRQGKIRRFREVKVIARPRASDWRHNILLGGRNHPYARALLRYVQERFSPYAYWYEGKLQPLYFQVPVQFEE